MNAHQIPANQSYPLGEVTAVANLLPNGGNVLPANTSIYDALTFKEQPRAYKGQNNPVSGLYYTVLNTTSYVKIKSIALAIDWGVTQPTITVRLTVDSEVYLFYFSIPVNTQGYWCIFGGYSGGNGDGLIIASDNNLHDLIVSQGSLIEGRSVKVEIKTDWAVTQPTQMRSTVRYATR